MPEFVQPGVCEFCGQIIPKDRIPCSDGDEAARRAKVAAPDTPASCREGLRKHGY